MYSNISCFFTLICDLFHVVLFEYQENDLHWKKKLIKTTSILREREILRNKTRGDKNVTWTV